MRTLYALPTSGGSPKKIYDRTAGPGGSSTNLTGDGKELFWSLDQALLTAQTDGTGFRQLTTGLRQVRGLAVDSAAVYVADAADGKVGSVVRVDRVSGAKTTLLAHVAPRPWGVFVDGTQLYVINNGTGSSVSRISTDGRSIFGLAENIKDGTSVVAQGDVVVWTSATPGAVFRATRNVAK